MQQLFVLWLWLWSLPPCLSCTTGSPAQCQKASLVPGSNLAGEGFDVVTMERKRAYVIDVETWEMKPNKTCKLCPNPYLRNEVQKVPVAVVDWRALPQCKLQLTSTVYESSEQFVESSMNMVDPNWKNGFHLNYSASLMVGGTHSKPAKMAMDKSKQDKYTYIGHDVHCSYYSYQLKEKPPLHTEFAQSLEKLPALYNNQTKAEYHHLLRTYGTHFIKKVQLGGRVSSLTSLPLCKMTLDGYTETQVKDCLDAEAFKTVKNVTNAVKPYDSYCMKIRKQGKIKDTFHSMFHERITEIEGGQVEFSDLLFSSTPQVFLEWTNSLKTTPGVVTYSLDPLPLLVHSPQSKRDGLKKAVEDYILENALYKHCSGKCSKGSKPSLHDSCTCVCKQNQYINNHCCPKKVGLAQLTVKVLQATELWGDIADKTDAFVRISFSNMITQTEVIENNDNPVWNDTFTFDMVVLSSGMKLKLEVWDEDKMWYKEWNDKLGSCSISPVSGNYSSICPLNHGTLQYSYMLQCAPWLGGKSCTKYNPTPGVSKVGTPYTSRNAVNITSSLRMHIKMGGPVNPLLFLQPRKEKKSNKTQAVPDDIHAYALPEL